MQPTNTYLTADCHEKIWMVDGPEFGLLKAGTAVFLVKIALYGLKSACATICLLLADTLLMDTGYCPTKADPDVWLASTARSQGQWVQVLQHCTI